MSESEKHLWRCVDTIRADKNLSEETLILMFHEFGHKLIADGNLSHWRSVKNELPKVYGKYEVYRSGCSKQHSETWNNTGWAYNNNDITHWRTIKPPPQSIIDTEVLTCGCNKFGQKLFLDIGTDKYVCVECKKPISN